MLNRVVYYSKYDGAGHRCLLQTEKLLENYSISQIIGINDNSEIFNIKLYFDNDVFLSTWSASKRQNYISILEKAWNDSKQFWLQINDDNIIDYLNEIEFFYKESFWTILSLFDIHKKIEPRTFQEILKLGSLKYILNQYKIVSYFSKEIKNHLLLFNKAAELLLTEYEQHHENGHKKMYFPENLSNADKEQILLNYLNSTNPNLNYIRLIQKLKNLKISDKTLLLANSVSKKLNEKIILEGYSQSIRYGVRFVEDQMQPLFINTGSSEIVYNYSLNYLESCKSPESIIHIFRKLFYYLDFQGCINLVVKNSKMDLFYKILLKSKYEYSTNISFDGNDIISHQQIILYYNFLKTNNESLENVIIQFVNKYLNKNYSIKNLNINLTPIDIPILGKIRMISPEFESLLKQYKLFVEDGEINQDLRTISSSTTYFNEVLSLVDNKYAYSSSPQCEKHIWLFFNDQSYMSFIRAENTKSKNFYELIKNCKIKYNELKDYEKREVDQFVKDDILDVNESDILEVKDKDYLYILNLLYDNGVISIWHQQDRVRKKIFDLEEKGFIIIKGTLLTKQEIDYFSYHLNKRRFTNSLDLRNKYSHGTNPNSEIDQESDYFILLKMLILLILKIEDDLILYNLANKV